MSNLLEHAKRELEAVGYDLSQTEEDPNKWICESVLSLIETFAEQGHSGSSAPYCIGYFKKLAAFEPLSPLTGADSEWTDVAQEMGTPMFQNKRCGSVFKNGNGRAYDIDGKVFQNRTGGRYGCSKSRVYIKFPYTPKTKYVRRWWRK